MLVALGVRVPGVAAAVTTDGSSAALADAAAATPGCKPNTSAPCHLKRGAVPNMPKGVAIIGAPGAANG